MIRKDYHLHTNLCDGANSPEEMVQSAIAAGMSTIGFSGHSYTFFDESYCMSRENTHIYRGTIEALKEKYQSQIKILCGIEQDFYSAESTNGYDYVIGSVHYLKLGNEYVPVDETKDILIEAAKNYFGGDMYALAEEYFRTVSRVVDVTGANIIGHLDLITKFNENSALFDETHPRYVAAYQKAVDALIPYGVPFEINTGAISRGYRSVPYPSAGILAYIKEKGGKVILSSDSHRQDTLCFQFDRWETWAKDMGLSITTEVSK